MLSETEIIIKQLLLTALKAESLEEVQAAIKFLCSKEVIAEAERIVDEVKNL